MMTEEKMHRRMNCRTAVVTLGLLLSSMSQARAQNATQRAVLRAAGAFLRDSLPPQPIIVDNEMFRARPAIDAADADDVAHAIGAGRGRFGDVVKCENIRREKVCTALQRKTVLALARPSVQDGFAVVDAYWVHVTDDRLAGRTARLKLVRDAGGRWRVSEMRETGHS
jgi:hypothetical protein